jgi:thioredoxin reductase
LFRFVVMEDNFDIIIIGGSYAGLSAAMALGRALKNVLIIDSGQPCNRQTPHSHNFITHDGSTPADISALALKQVLAYPTIIHKNGLAVDTAKHPDGFKVFTDDGAAYTAKKLLFTTGVKDIMPNIPGFADCWGITVIHCPYCHGYEVRHEPTGLFANGDIAAEFGSLLSNWTSDLTILTNGPSLLTEAQTDKLNRHKIGINPKVIKELLHQNGYLSKVIFEDDTELSLTAMYAKIKYEQHCNLPAQLGCELTDMGFIKVNEMQETSVEGIYAGGDNTTMMRSLSNAIAAGGRAGAIMNHKIVMEAF